MRGIGDYILKILQIQEQIVAKSFDLGRRNASDQEVSRELAPFYNNQIILIDEMNKIWPVDDPSSPKGTV